jgi:hypothetical protein
MLFALLIREHFKRTQSREKSTSPLASLNNCQHFTYLGEKKFFLMKRLKMKLALRGGTEAHVVTRAP